jgi:excisionase family DNA binding protein
MEPDLKEALKGLTVSVDQMGQALGLGRAAAYKAVRSGQIHSIRIGGAIRIPTAPLRRMLGLDQAEAA